MTAINNVKHQLLLSDTPAALQRNIMITEADGVRLTKNYLSGEIHLRYAFTDHLNSSGGESDEVGNVTSREEYYSYGGSAGADEEVAEVDDRTYRHSNKERDVTGLYYYGWRYYQPESGRWLSADPGVLIDGMNLFRFVRNNPQNLIDAEGRMPGPPPVPSRPASTLSASSRAIQTSARQALPAMPPEKSFIPDPAPLIFSEDRPPDLTTLENALLHRDLSSRYQTLLVKVDGGLVIYKNLASMLITEQAEITRQEVAAKNEVFAWKFSNKLHLDLVPVTAFAGGSTRAIVSSYIPNQPLENFNRAKTSMLVFDFLINARDRDDQGGNVLMNLNGGFKAIDHESILEVDYAAIAKEKISDASIDIFFRRPETKGAFLSTDWASFYDQHAHLSIPGRERAKTQFVERTRFIRSRMQRQ